MPNIVKALKCPKCGSQDIQHYEEAVVTRDVVGIDDYGKTWISGHAEVGDGEDERLHCNKCDCEWPLPDNIEFD